MVGARQDRKSKTDPPSGPIVLVVEDETLLRMLLADQLRDAGYVVVDAANAQQALCAVSRTSDLKAIVTDIQMPGSIGGMTLARMVRSMRPTVKIVLTSGYYAVVDGVEHDGFFPKPYDTSQIIAHVGTLLNERQSKT